jgi:hypothetical protein
VASVEDVLKPFYRVWRLTLVCGALVFAGACGAAGPPPAAEITGLHFTTSTSISSNPAPDVDVTLTDRAPSRLIYAATLALPVFPSGTFNCPFDPGIRYSIVFARVDGDALTAVLNPAGCGDVTISGSATRRALDPAYWASMAEGLGIRESTIYPAPLP